MGKVQLGVINEWGRAWAVPRPSECGPWAKVWFTTLDLEAERDYIMYHYLAPLTFELGGGAGWIPYTLISGAPPMMEEVPILSNLL
jgi:hypothetical protein